MRLTLTNSLTYSQRRFSNPTIVKQPPPSVQHPTHPTSNRSSHTRTHAHTHTGLLTLASVSWYASEVVQEYNKQQLVNATFVYEFGSALYVGWVSSVSKRESRGSLRLSQTKVDHCCCQMSLRQITQSSAGLYEPSFLTSYNLTPSCFNFISKCQCFEARNLEF